MSFPVTTRWVDIDGPDFRFEGYLAVPPAGNGPGLLLLQEIFGVNPHIRGVAEQYALAGFVVLAPDLFWRQAPRVELGYQDTDRGRAMSLMQALTPDQVAQDLPAAVAALRALPETAGRNVGALGYCMGGRLAFRAAATAGIQAAVAYYGGGIQHQLDLAPRITCPSQFHYGESDDHIPPAAVAAVRQAMAGKPAEIHVYPGAGHGFNCWTRAGYQPAAAALAHGRSLQFLASHLF